MYAVVAFAFRPSMLVHHSDWGKFALLGLCYGPGVGGLLPLGVSRTSAAHTVFLYALGPQPGWRVRAVTPITKSGVSTFATEAVEANASSLSTKASQDFVGYEISYYAVNTRPGGGIFIRFSSAEVKKDGKTSQEPRPSVLLFDLPSDARFVRLLFETRVTASDHDQGIVAAPTMEQLEALTTKVQADPEHHCTASPQSFCSWVPVGIVVQPEERNPQHSKQWIPAT